MQGEIETVVADEMSAGVPKLREKCADGKVLWQWLKVHLGLHTPRRAFCGCHQAPFDYIHTSYFDPGKDIVVWGPRGGGKTRLAAAATLLDLLHKPGISVRVLGGSLEQSLRMWEHLLPDVEALVGEELLKSRCRSRRIELKTGSTAAVLTQSQTSVRGQRVQKMRCDEVEMFDKGVWSAVGPTTKSKTVQLTRDGEVIGPGSDECVADTKTYTGTIEALSTHHQVGGRMQEIIERAQASGGATELIQWCILDVMERCPPERVCEGCALWEECGGRAKEVWEDTGLPKADGFYAIDDIIRTKGRLSKEAWESEMLCLRPTREGRVFPDFSAATHVRPFDPVDLGLELSLGVDFGFSAPFVALWIGKAEDGTVYVRDERVVRGVTVPDHVPYLKAKRWPVSRIFCDPAGRNANEQTGRSSVKILQGAGFTVTHRVSRIHEGIELVRLLCQPALGKSKLVVHPDCRQLIKAMESYRYPATGTSEVPEKDGEFDHPIDALRYWVFNNLASKTARGRAT